MTRTIPSIIAMAAVGLLMAAPDAHALLDDNSVRATAIQGQLQGQKQSQRQNQRQFQGQGQQQKWTQNQTFESRPDGPSIGIGLAGLPSFSNSGIMNACAGAEAWTFSVGGSVGLAGGQISGAGGLIGFGDSNVVTIVPCEIRESVVLLGEAGVDTAATAVACLHPYMKIGLEAQMPGICGGVPSAPPAIKVTASNPPERSGYEGTGSKHPDFASLQ